MNYLFFDIECANLFGGTGKICEFGYVLVDEGLNVIKNGIYLIDPDVEFDWYVKENIISYPVEEYRNAPKYPAVYEEHIRPLLELPDTVFVGHRVSNDLKFLNDEARRYSLPRFAGKTIDASVIHRNYNGLSKPLKLGNIVAGLGLGEVDKLHNSEYDALMTLEYVRLMCRESGLSFAQLIKEYSVKKRVINNITDNEANEQVEQPV